MSEGIVFDIQKFCVDDGPGIRTTVFLKGCPLRCRWCHNAEGLSKKIQLYYSANLCMGCQACAAVCPAGGHTFEDGVHCVANEKCIACGACAEVCPGGAVRPAGKNMTADEVLAVVMEDLPFYTGSGGGMTLSGGEPLSQGEFAVELAQKAKEAGLHVCIETSGHCKPEVLQAVAAHTDLFLFDFKHYSPEAHKAYTGVDNKLILENLRALSRQNKPVILRCPIIPGCNDQTEHYEAIACVANEMANIQQIHLEPYHPLGLSKYASLGMEPNYTNETMMDKQAVQNAAYFIQARTKTPVNVT